MLLKGKKQQVFFSSQVNLCWWETVFTFSNSKTDINVALGPPHHWVAFWFLREGCVTQHDGICLSHGRRHVHH